MKQIDLTPVQNGVRKLGAVKSLFEHMQAGYKESLGAFAQGVVGNTASAVALYGLVNTGIGPAFAISAGAVYHNGEVFFVDAFAGSPPGGQVPVLVLEEIKTALDYTDGTQQDTLINRKYKIQFGASGSGIVNYIDLVQLRSTSPWVNKGGDTMTGPLNAQGGIKTALAQSALLLSVINIGDWDMDANQDKNVVTGISDLNQRIRSIDVLIRNDADTETSPFMSNVAQLGGGSVSDAPGALNVDNAGNVLLRRKTGEVYDSTNYDQTGYNRGWITIWYAA
jgi:hypothetical protein